MSDIDNEKPFLKRVDKEIEELKEEAWERHKKHGINYSVYMDPSNTPYLTFYLMPTASRNQAEVDGHCEWWNTLPDGEQMFTKKTAIYLEEIDRIHYKPHLYFDVDTPWDHIRPILEVTRLTHPDAFIKNWFLIKPKYENELFRNTEIRIIRE